jgi:hypothetical protein
MQLVVITDCTIFCKRGNRLSLSRNEIIFWVLYKSSSETNGTVFAGGTKNVLGVSKMLSKVSISHISSCSFLQVSFCAITFSITIGEARYCRHMYIFLVGYVFHLNSTSVMILYAALWKENGEYWCTYSLHVTAIKATANSLILQLECSNCLYGNAPLTLAWINIIVLM